VSELSIEVALREGRGKGANRKLRADGRIPAVVYGHGNESVALSLDPVQLERQIKTSHAGMNTLFDLTGEGSVAGRTVLVKELQREPVRGSLLHADLFEISADEQIQVAVPIHLSGDAAGVVMGGVIEHVLREVEISCLPRAIPDEIIADVAALEIGDSLHVSDLPLPEGIELITDASLSVVSVILPKVVEEETEAAAEDEAAEGEAAEAPAEGDEEKPAEGGEGD